MVRHLWKICSLSLMMTLAGCTSETGVETSTALPRPSAEGAKYLLSAAPTDAQDVISMREAVDDNQEVVVIGRIGGSHDPWVEGMAAFSVVDRSLPACSDIPGDSCPKPWDYCCATDKLPGATTLVKVVDEQGEIIPTDARELLGVSELQTVVIQGTARKDDAGNITVLASGIYIDPANPGQVVRGEGDSHNHDHDHSHAPGDDHTHQHEGESPAGANDNSTPDDAEGES